MIDTRRYQLMIGAIGLLLVVAFSVYLYVNGNRGTHPGIRAGQPLKHFVAPLATSNLNAPANVAPRCDPARPARRGLNVCGRGPIVLAFFAIGGKPCVRAVSALQALAPRYPQATFAAVAAGGAKRATLKLIHEHHWTIPVAYDSTAAVAELYGVDVCPMIEVARNGGIVSRLMIGERWEHRAALANALTQVLSERR
jgi:hypothetical protein